MIEFVRYRAEHCLAIAPHFDPTQFAVLASPAVARTLESPFSWTALVDGEPIACAGLANKWLDSWTAWAYLTADARKHMLPITRAVQRMLPDMPRGRIEATTPLAFAPGRKWLSMLGFRCETPDGMARFAPDGQTYALYSRINS